MYSVDINFLNDREERQIEVSQAPRSSGAVGDRRPLYAGLAVLVAVLAGVGSFFGISKFQQGKLLERQSELDAQLTELQQKLAQVETIKQQTVAVRSESRALAGVFEKIRPWSAIVKDVQNRIPTRTQISALNQTAGTAEAGPDGVDVLPQAGGLALTGTACSFDDVNDFVLTLQNSPFLDGETVKLQGSSLGGAVLGRCPGEAERDEPLKLVTYNIAANIKAVPVDQFQRLLAELENQQASVGLSSRLKALLETGALE